MLKQTRAYAQALEKNLYYKAFFFIAIVLNGITLGMETSRPIMAMIGVLLLAADRIFRIFFVLEIMIRWIAEGRNFWKQGWNLFDVVVIVISLFPELSLLSACRVVRLFKLLRIVADFRENTESLTRAVIASRAAFLMLLLVMYVFSVMSSKFFGDTHPELFGDVIWAANTHFDLMLGEGVGDMVRILVDAGYSRWVQLYFKLYVVISLFVLASFLIAMIVDAVQKVTNAHILQRVNDVANEVELILRKLSELEVQIAANKKSNNDPK